MASGKIKSFTEINQCRCFNCIYHEPGNVGCRLKYVHIDINGKCVYFKEIVALLEELAIKNSEKQEKK